MAFDRFRGPNGLSQMIALVESATPERREMLMRSLQIDNPALAAFIKTKVLTIDKVFTWSQEALVELIHHLQPHEVEALERLAKPKRDWSERVSAAILDAKIASRLETPSTNGSPKPNQLNQQSPAKFSLPAKLSLDVVEISLIARIRELERLGRLKLNEIDPARAA